MMWRVTLAGALWAMAAAHAAAAAAPEGAALHRALLGAWCNSSDGGKTCWAVDRFRPDGTFTACGRHAEERRPFSGSGVVEVTGRTMCYRVTQASENFWLQPGARYCTEIVSIDRRQHRYRDIDTGAEFTLLRRPVRQARCPE